MSDPFHSRCSPYPPAGPNGTLTPFADGWRTETVLGLAAGIRAEEAFDRLPILADALEEAGCDDLQMLNHCRYCPQHTPKCWALERVMPSDQLHWTGDMRARLAAAVAEAVRQGHPDDPNVRPGRSSPGKTSDADLAKEEERRERRDRIVIRIAWGFALVALCMLLKAIFRL